MSMQPVIASQSSLRAPRAMSAPPPVRAVPMPVLMPTDAASAMPVYVTPALLQAMATGNPVWPAAMIVEDAPMQLVSAHYSFEVR